jgi:hypothetical protein
VTVPVTRIGRDSLRGNQILNPLDLQLLIYLTKASGGFCKILMPGNKFYLYFVPVV